jgi:hypothetical protein
MKTLLCIIAIVASFPVWALAAKGGTVVTHLTSCNLRDPSGATVTCTPEQGAEGVVVETPSGTINYSCACQFGPLAEPVGFIDFPCAIPLADGSTVTTTRTEETIDVSGLAELSCHVKHP